MNQIVKAKPRHGVVLELDGDGIYHVAVDGEVTYSSRVLAAAEIAYEDALEPRTRPARELRAKEQAHFAATAIAADAARQKAAAAKRSGGKGGKGGVS
jgi:hypothetical protein